MRQQLLMTWILSTANNARVQINKKVLVSDQNFFLCIQPEKSEAVVKVNAV